jgi:hypothetical protein
MMIVLKTSNYLQKIMSSSTNLNRTGYFLIAVTAFLALTGIMSHDPIPQDINYHLFVDSREIGSIPNFWNIVTSTPFAVVGILGLYKLQSPGKLKVLSETRTAYTMFFFGTLLVGFGSMYYHITPNNQTLVWDRLPMTIAFMALFSIIISEFISPRSGKFLLYPLILAGMSSVLYWYFSEIQGHGDLRLYVLVQFYPILVIPVILICYRSKCSHAHAYWWLLLIYIIAKVFEYLDIEIYNASGFISGHSLKHLAASMGVYLLLHYYQKRICI